jgi:hypothetical protein
MPINFFTPPDPPQKRNKEKKHNTNVYSPSDGHAATQIPPMLIMNQTPRAVVVAAARSEQEKELGKYVESK